MHHVHVSQPLFIILLVFASGWRGPLFCSRGAAGQAAQVCGAPEIQGTLLGSVAVTTKVDMALQVHYGLCCGQVVLSTQCLHLCAVVQSLSKGAKIWGTVAEITHRELIISLPHGLKGHVPAAEVMHPPVHLFPCNPVRLLHLCHGDVCSALVM